MYEHPARRAPSQAPAVFYFETEGMCIGENNIRRPGDHRERAEGERPGPGPAKQRWEAVFRRERGPVSPDRTQGGPCLSFRDPICGPSGPEKGETLSAFVCFPIHFERSTFP